MLFAQIDDTRGKVTFSSDPCPDNRELYMEILWNSAIKDITVTYNTPNAFIGLPRIEIIDDGHAIVHLTASPTIGTEARLAISYRFSYQRSGFWALVGNVGYTWTFSPSSVDARNLIYPAGPIVTGVSYLFRLSSPIWPESNVSGFNWYIDGNIQPVAGTAVNLTFATPGNHAVMWRPFNHCGRVTSGSSRTVTVTCRPAIFAIKQPSPNVICGGSPISLTAESTLTPQSIVWKKDGVTITNATGNTLSVGQVGSYEVTATFSDGCVGQDTRVVTASEYPTQVITKINGLTQGFSGDPVVLEVVGGSDATDFHWKVNGNGNPFTDATGTGSFRRVIFRPGAASDVPYEIEVTPRRNTCPGVPFKRLFTVLSQAMKIVDTVKMYHPDLSGTPLGYLYLPNHTPERSNGCFGQLGPVTINATLDLGKYYNLGKHAFSADVKLKIVAHVDAPAQNQEWIFPLHIDQTAPEQMFSKRIDINPELIRFFTIEREGNSYVCNSAAAASAIRLMVTSTEEDVVDIQNVKVYPDAVTQDQANKRWEQTFTWSTTCQDVTDYLFLIVKQYGEVAPNNLKSPTLWKNALRIRTESSDRSVTISMGEGSGKYYWRMMPLGSQEGGLANPINLGDTSDVMPFTYTHPEEDKNWIYSRSFTESNKVSEHVTYGNGLLQIAQQVTKIQGENRIVAAQNIQDNVGRDAISSLPIPVTGIRSLQYVDKLLTDSIGNLYRAPDFDGRQNPKTATARGDYYSGEPVKDAQNVLQNDRVPSAEGFPFTQTDFLNDGTGRVSQQTAAGFAHSKKGGHTVRTFYTQASEAELVALFGNEAPQDSSVEKVTTYDANNVASIAFQTKDGQIIATGLAITGTGGPLEELSTAPKADSFPAHYQRVKNNLRINDATIVSRTSLFLTMPGDVTVNYEITPAQLQEICGGNGNADLVAYYPFEENVQDVSGHNNHGIAGLGATIGKDILDRNSAYALTGSSTSFIQVPHTPDMRFDARDFTVSFWVKRSTNTNSTWSNAPGVGKWNNLATAAPSPGTNEWALILHSEGGNTPAFMIEGGTTRHKVVASNAPLTAGNWYHLVGVRQGNLLKIYVNGRLENTLSTGSTAVSINNKELPLQIGRTGTFGTAAIFDDVQIYRRALSAEEINQLRDRSTLCTTCDYTVSFKLLKNGTVVSGVPLPAPFTINAGSCSTQVSRKYVMPSTSLTLEGGVNYTLEKYLTLNNKTRDSATVTFIDSATAKVEAFYRAKAKNRLDEINGYINRHEYDLLEQYLKTNATDDAANKQYILTLLPAGAGGCQQIIYIPKWTKCPVEVNTGNNCGPDGSSFEQYFEDYYKDRTDLLTVVNGETILNYAYFTNQYPGAAEREQHYKRGELNAMIRNLIAANPQLGTGQAACDSVWKVWKSEVMRYEAGITYTPEPQENTIGLEPAIPAKYTLLQSFLTSLDVHLQREATEEDADLCVGTGRPLFIERTTLYGKMGTTIIAPDLAHAYALVYYNSDVAGMKDMLRFYANIQDPDPEHPREPVLEDFNALLACDKYKISQSTSMGDLGFAQQDSQDAEALAEQQMNALRNQCGEACENRESEFRQAIIGKLMAIPGTKIQHYNVYRDATYQNNIWVGILDSSRNVTSYTVSQCDLEALTTALVQNCRNKYCNVTLTPRDTVITNAGRTITYRTYGTNEEIRKIQKAVMYDFDLRLSDGEPTCDTGWDLISKATASNNTSPRIEWMEPQEPLPSNNSGLGSGNERFVMNVDPHGNLVYLGDYDAETINIYKRAPNGSIVLKKAIRRIAKSAVANQRSGFSFSLDKNGRIIVVVNTIAGDVFDFDPGSGVTALGDTNGSSLVIAIYDVNGKLLIAKSTPFIRNDFDAPRINIDHDGNIYIVCGYSTADLDFSIAEKNIQSTVPSSFVLVKYDVNLTYLWHITIDNQQLEYVALVVDENGAPIIATGYRRPFSIRNASGDLLVPSEMIPDETSAVIKFTAQGTLGWIKTFNSYRYRQSHLTIGDNNNLYITGAITGNPNGGFDFDVIKLSPLGDIVWNGKLGNGYSLSKVGYDAKTNSLVIGGHISSGADINFLEGEFLLQGGESFNSFIANYSTDGRVISAEIIPGQIFWNAYIVAHDGTAFVNNILEPPFNAYTNRFCLKYALSYSRCPVSKNLCFKFTGPRIQGIKIPKNMEAYTYDPAFPDCEAELASRLHTAIDRQVDQLITARVSSYRDQYYNVCGSPTRLDDKLTILKKDGQYHYTLYYYDRAGNLVRTVPPDGIAAPLPVGSEADVIASRKLLPQHKMITEYQYNAAGYRIRVHSPDGNYLLLHNAAGTTRQEAESFTKPSGTDESSLNASRYYNTIIYDDKGQLRFSRNAKQKIDGSYSYIKYDEVGRVIESGEGTSYNEATLLAQRNDIGPGAYPTQGRRFVTNTIYNNPFEISSVVEWPSGYEQEENNLRNRVSFAYTDKDGMEASVIEDRVYTIYNYDVHGNVKWTVQILPGLHPVGMRYDYDLLSGTVSNVQFSAEDPNTSFYHKYSYDVHNRLTKVQTSRDGFIWDAEATYLYYPHGPLKRTLIGEDLVQGIDYTYTINGWIKGINHGLLDMINDPGKDAVGGSLVARDAFGMGVGYYIGDYKFSGASLSVDGIGNLDPLASRNLYNGNISSWTSNMLYPDNSISSYAQLTGNHYTYDKLNRIGTSKLYAYENSQFKESSTYSNSYSYDGNGNIRSASNGDASPSVPASRAYNYENQVTNRLNSIAGQAAYNYQYDAIGNLVRDVEHDVDIHWNASGKVEQVSRKEGVSSYATNFIYDAMGNRVSKTRVNPSGLRLTDYYVRDARGNVMGVYEKIEQSGQQKEVILKEIPLYGSDRIGIYSATLPIEGNDGQTETEPDELRISASGTKNQYEGMSYLVNSEVELTMGEGFSYQSSGNDIFGIRVGKHVVTATQPPSAIHTRTLNNRRYELKDHLGNVRATISDTKLSSLLGSVSSDYKPEMLGVYNYYPFGLEMPGRVWESNEKYRYGFNGKEKDQNGEWGSLNYDYGFRVYNPSIGKFLSVDPLTSSYPMLTPYQFASNRPIDGIDLDGLEYVKNRVTIDAQTGEVLAQKEVWHNPEHHNVYGAMGPGVLYEITVFHSELKVVKEDHIQRFIARNGGALGVRTEYGNYYGETALKVVTSDGSLGRTDDYTLSAVDAVDNFAKTHDQGYDAVGADGETGLFSDWGTTPADEAAAMGWRNFLEKYDAGDIDPFSHQQITKEEVQAAFGGEALFSHVIKGKKTEISDFIRVYHPAYAHKDAMTPRNGPKKVQEIRDYHYQQFLDLYMFKGTDGFYHRKLDMWNKKVEPGAGKNGKDKVTWTPIVLKKS
jgi:RHS repeat-associated protein